MGLVRTVKEIRPMLFNKLFDRVRNIMGRVKMYVWVGLDLGRFSWNFVGRVKMYVLGRVWERSDEHGSGPGAFKWQSQMQVGLVWE